MIILPQELISYIILALIIFIIALIVWNFILAKKIKTLSRGNGKYNLEETIKSIEANITDFNKFSEKVQSHLVHVEKRLKKSVQGLSIVNFRAFEGLDSGGNQSFATAFLNEHGDGIIISTMHSRDRVNVFAKEVKNFKANLSLTKEESDALTQAKESCKL
jgi:hypothetical protein